MTNENFQEIVLSELRDLKDGMSRLEERQTYFEKKLDVVYDQTVRLSEYNTDINSKLNSINTKVDNINAKVDNLVEDFKSIHEILGEHEVSIRTLRRIDFERRKEYYEAMSRENEAKTKRSFPMDE